jgi:acyl-CoA reductase-like NAD-dependent aldehyde dehydrogenase
MKDQTMSKIEVRNEGMRIGGEIVFTDETIPVLYPYTNEVVGHVPAGTAEHAGLSKSRRITNLN